MIKLLHGDCLEVLKTLEDNSVDSVVTDPPYFLTGSGGSGFMGKEWDSQSPSLAVAESVFRSARLDLSTAGESTVAQFANIEPLPSSIELLSHSNAAYAINQSSELPRELNPSTSSAPEIVITKAEALVLCREWLPSHIARVESLPSHASFVASPLFTEPSALKNIARSVVSTLQEEPAWLAQITPSLKTAKVTQERFLSEIPNGIGSEKKSIEETTGNADGATLSARAERSNVTTLSHTEFQKTIRRLISLRSVKAAISECTKSPSFIPSLSELFHYKWALECFRVLKPGGHMLAFCGPRTYHRMASGVENAGFEIRDQIQWIFGSGFPKSLNIGLAIDKAAGTPNRGRATLNVKDQMSERDDRDYSVKGVAYEPATDAAKQWAGWGTALKPANEPICLARKPLSEKTVAKNVLKYGTGGINIDASRIDAVRPAATYSQPDIRGNAFNSEREIRRVAEVPANLGRFPANLMLDEEAAALLDLQSGLLKNGGNNYCGPTGDSIFGNTQVVAQTRFAGDTGGASRFFYCAKASRSEKGEGNGHPTVKPQKLMQYLIRMITPPGGIVLDCFMGSGSTGLAAKSLGFSFIGIEREPEYLKIAEGRLGAA